MGTATVGAIPVNYIVTGAVDITVVAIHNVTMDIDAACNVATAVVVCNDAVGRNNVAIGAAAVAVVDALHKLK